MYEFLVLLFLVGGISTFLVWLVIRASNTSAQTDALSTSSSQSAKSAQFSVSHLMPPPMPVPRFPKKDARMSPGQRQAAAGGHLTKLTWLGETFSIRIGELKLEDPLAYFFDSRCSSIHDEPAAIDLALPIASKSYTPAERELPYWPKYSGLTPGQRRNYLEWLSTGRVAVPVELGYAFLFFYGLERRSLSERADLSLVFKEVLRLRELYAKAGQLRGSFDSHTSAFLAFLLVREPSALSLKRVYRFMMTSASWGEDDLSALLAWFAATNTALPDWAAFTVAQNLPQSQRSVVVGRVGDEFRKLYYKRFRERFGDGIRLESAKRKRFSYRPASAALESVETHSIDLSGQPKQLQPISEIWNECIHELRKLSAAVGKNGNEKTSISAWEAMPSEIRAGVDHPLTEDMCRLVQDCTTENGRTVVSVGRLASVLGIAAQSRLTIGQSRRLRDIASDIGYGVEPDAQLTNQAYRTEDSVALFLLTTDEMSSPQRYNAAACMLRVSMSVIDGSEHDGAEEKSRLIQQICRTFELNDQEHRRLEALGDIVMSGTGDLSSLSRLAKDLTRPQLETIAKFILVLILADHVVLPEELKAAKKCYRALGFSKEDTDHALQLLGATTDPNEPVTVEAARPGPAGEPISSPPKMTNVSGPGLKLDHGVIEAILRETQEVAMMLTQAMNRESQDSGLAVEEPAPVPAATSVPSPAPSLVSSAVDPSVSASKPPQQSIRAELSEHVVVTNDPALPARYAAFYQALLSRGQCTIAEAEALARQHGHMLSGALEVLNEWSTERFGGQIFIEDGNQLMLERELLN